MNNELEEIIKEQSDELIVDLEGLYDPQLKYAAIRRVLTKVARKTSEVYIDHIYESTKVGK